MVLHVLRKLSLTGTQIKPLAMFFHITVAHSYSFSFIRNCAEDYIEQNKIFSYFTINSQWAVCDSEKERPFFLF
jgi:hypothetical protein